MAGGGNGKGKRVRSITLLIPCFNEAEHIGAMLEDLAEDRWVRDWGKDLQVMVVDDGSADETAAIAGTYSNRFADLSILSLQQNVGKGEALKRGIAQAKGNVVAFLDGDHTFDLEGLSRFQSAIEGGADVVVGDRRDPDSIFFVPSHVIPYIHLRHFVGTRFNMLVRLMTDLDVADTQCGFKMFTKEAATHSFSRIRVGGFIFDVEVLLAAQRAGYRIETLPVRLLYDSPEPVWVTFTMSAQVSRSLMRVLRGQRQGDYGDGSSSDASDEPGPERPRNYER